MPASPSAYVLDRFALLAYFEGEAGMSRVRSVLAGGEARMRIGDPEFRVLADAGLVTVEWLPRRRT